MEPSRTVVTCARPRRSVCQCSPHLSDFEYKYISGQPHVRYMLGTFLISLSKFQMKLNLNNKLVKSIKGSVTILFQLKLHIQDNPFRFILHTFCLARIFVCYEGNSMFFIAFVFLRMSKYSSTARYGIQMTPTLSEAKVLTDYIVLPANTSKSNRKICFCAYNWVCSGTCKNYKLLGNINFAI